MTKSKVQQYMERHKITPLFEDLMNQVVNEQPDDLLLFLIKCLYKKAAIPIPKDLRSNPLRKSSPERIVRRSKSPEKALSSTQAWAVASGPDLVDRSYDKPWQSHSKKTRVRDEDRSEPKTRPGRKQKADWVADTKVTSTTFDDLFEEEPGRPSSQTAPVRPHSQLPSKGTHKREEMTDITRAWSKHIGLEGSEDGNYRSQGYRGPHCDRNDSDPLAGEIMLAKEESSPVVSSRKDKGVKLEAEQHRQELERLLQAGTAADREAGRDGMLNAGYDADQQDSEQDEAIELLEDPDDLIAEGVTNVPTSGYRLSQNLRQRNQQREETSVKLNINLLTGNTTIAPSDFSGSQYGEDFFETELERPPTGMSYQSAMYSQLSPDASDEEFESVSQVVGPRLPVWRTPNSDLETYRPEDSVVSTTARTSNAGPKVY